MGKKGIIAGFFLAVCLLFLLVLLTNVSFVSANIYGEQISRFNTGGWYCDTDNGNWVYPAHTNETGSFPEQIVKNNCSKYASENNNVSCCKIYQGCNSDGICSGWSKYCYQYDNEYSCNWGTPQIVSMNNMNHTCGSVAVKDGCATIYQCRCLWDKASNSKTKCMDVLNIITDYVNSSCTSPLGTNTCTWSTDILENNCNNSLNYIRVSKTATWSGTNETRPAGCVNMERQDTCPITMKLPFFGNFMLFVSICLIIAIYFFKDVNHK